MQLKIKLQAHSLGPLKLAESIIRRAVDGTGATLGGTAMLPTRRRIWCVLRSPHVNSKSREHFERRTHQRILVVRDVTKAAVESLMAISMPAGIYIDVRI